MFEAGLHLGPEAFRDLPPEVQRLDVREPWEHALASIPGSVLIPLGELEARAGELDPGRPVAAYCHHGVRSLHALRILRERGFTDLAHLAGGIDAYRRVDASLAVY